MRIAPLASVLAMVFILAPLVSATQADEKNVTIRFLGGAKRIPLEGLQVTIRRDTGNWSTDRTKLLASGKTDKNGQIGLTLADGYYYVEIASKKELPYLDRPVGFNSPPNNYSRMIQVGKEATFEFNLADACKLILRAIDADTGKGIPGVCFVTESETAEQWGIAIYGDNLGANHKQQWNELTDENGYLIRYMGPRDGYTYFAFPDPDGYRFAGEQYAVTLPTPIGTEEVEYLFKFKKKN